MLGYTYQVWAWGLLLWCRPGDAPGVDLETPWVWAWRPPSCWSEEPPGQTPQLPPPGSGPGDPPGQTPQAAPPDVALETYKAYWDTPPGDLQGLL